MRKCVLLVAVAMGCAMAYVDTRPNWDDAGISAGVIFLGSAALAALSPGRPWQIALAVGIWIPVIEIPTSREYAALLALLFAFAGAYLGAGGRRLLFAHFEA